MKTAEQSASKRESGSKADPKVIVRERGPYLVTGKIPLRKQYVVRNGENVPVAWKDGEEFPAQETYALCRCGGSKNKPFCDGSHATNGFVGKETASREPFDRKARVDGGPGIALADDRELCAGLQFCHRAGGVWGLVSESDDPKARELIVEIAGNCPTGRLVARGKGGKDLEPALEKGIGVLEDPGRHVSGPLWIKGGIPLESQDGTKYESRNRVTLCRCGRSENMPYCDGTHVPTHFKDGDKKL